jgi:hypothetical protein
MRKYQLTLNQEQAEQLVAVLGANSRVEVLKAARAFNLENYEDFPTVNEDDDLVDILFSDLWDSIKDKPNSPVNVSFIDVSERF